MQPIRFLVVGSSATARDSLTARIEAQSGRRVVAVSEGSFHAGLTVRQMHIDAVVFDLDMLSLDGPAILRRLASRHRVPVVAISAECRAKGPPGPSAAAALVCLPCSGTGTSGAVETTTADTATAALQAASSAVRPQQGPAGAAARDRVVGPGPVPGAPQVCHDRAPDAAGPGMTGLDRPASTIAGQVRAATGTAGAWRGVRAPAGGADGVIAMGASTGGTEALRTVLEGMPPTCPPIVIVQHMPAAFTGAFAARLDMLCAIHVREARDGDAVHPGLALIAPGGRHLRLVRQGAGLFAEVREGAPVSRHCPSVDVLFGSVAQTMGAGAVGVILTGMGADGARGLGEMRARGAATIGQDEATSVVYGMPRVAYETGAVAEQLPLPDIARGILRLVRP